MRDHDPCAVASEQYLLDIGRLKVEVVGLLENGPLARLHRPEHLMLNQIAVPPVLRPRHLVLVLRYARVGCERACLDLVQLPLFVVQPVIAGRVGRRVPVTFESQ